MKAFSFRLEKVLRWREAQLDIEKSRAAAALARISEIQAAIEQRRSEAAEAAQYIAREPDSSALAAYGGFLERDRARSVELNDQMGVAKKALAAELKQVIEANRKLHLLEKLKSAERAGWRREFDQELGQFADEAFLARLQSRRQRRPYEF